MAAPEEKNEPAAGDPLGADTGRGNDSFHLSTRQVFDSRFRRGEKLEGAGTGSRVALAVRYCF
jgi:hypothetical protein